ncbi:MAG: hypothetical protein ABUK01_16455 [Leptospirales bacterium]
MKISSFVTFICLFAAFPVLSQENFVTVDFIQNVFVRPDKYIGKYIKLTAKNVDYESLEYISRFTDEKNKKVDQKKFGKDISLLSFYISNGAYSFSNTLYVSMIIRKKQEEIVDNSIIEKKPFEINKAIIIGKYESSYMNTKHILVEWLE